MNSSGTNSSLRVPTLLMIVVWAFGNAVYGAVDVMAGIDNWQSLRGDGSPSVMNGGLLSEFSLLLLLLWVSTLPILIVAMILGVLHLVWTHGGAIKIIAFVAVLGTGFIGVFAYNQTIHGGDWFSGYFRFFSLDVLGGLGYPFIATVVLLSALALLADRPSVALPAPVHQP